MQEILSTQQLRGTLLINEPLIDYNSWHVGGPASQFYMPADIEDLGIFLKSLSKAEKILWLGLGSNVLIRDGGFEGTVIYTQGRLKQLSLIDPHTIRAEAGVTCAKLAKFCAMANLAKGAFFAGIPGTVGGALAMNAGAFGDTTWDHVIQVETIDRLGKIRLRKPSDFKIAYREVSKPAEEWFVAGYFHLPAGDGKQEQQAVRELLKKRSQTQPIGEFSCGSVFRNPPNDHAARLIEACGLKGKKIGGAWVSTKHANFIINGGQATASDIEKLILYVQSEVARLQDVNLIPECHIYGKCD